LAKWLMTIHIANYWL